MNQPTRIKTGSLIERAAEVFDFDTAFGPAPTPAPEQDVRAAEPAPPPPPLPPVPEQVIQRPVEPIVPRQSQPSPRRAPIDRKRLHAAGFIVPEAPVSGLAEEFRIIKRQLLLTARGQGIAEHKRRSILVCSASSDEGKTFCAVNLALWMAGEKDLDVLLVDGDVAKPSVLPILGLEDAPGLIDAIADPDAGLEDLIIETDVPGLSILPAGRRANNATELLSSARTAGLIAELTVGRPRRIVIFDSPPALMASPASVLAAHVGQALMVVRADVTTEAELREAVALLSGCPNLSLMLNAAALAVPGRRFGSYYGYDE